MHSPSSVPDPVQVFPPYCSSSFGRARRFTPTPQVTEQPLQGPHSSHLQFTGHGCALHSLFRLASPTQSRPPSFAFFTFERERVLVPPPQVAVHLVQVSQLPHSQSTGQGSVWQGVTTCAGPVQFAPP